LDARLTWGGPTFLGSRCDTQHVKDEEQADEEERVTKPIDLILEDEPIGAVVRYEYQDAEKGQSSYSRQEVEEFLPVVTAEQYGST